MALCKHGNDLFAPDVKCIKCEENKKMVLSLLDLMTDRDRLMVFSRYCRYCGRDDSDEPRGCQCWNDE